MPTATETLAMGVFIPVSNRIALEDHLLSFLDQGGRAILFGEEADEFRSGRLRPERIADETPETVSATLQSLRKRSGRILISCDADLAAVNRLQALAGELPSPEDADMLSDADFFSIVHNHAKRSRELGFTLFLSPTADLIVENDWLRGRTLDPEPRARRLVDLHVRAIQEAGLTAGLKHFPGHPRIIGDPSTGAATVISDLVEIDAHLGAFRQGLKAGAGCVVLSSAIFQAYGGSANLSHGVIQMLRRDLGFDGLVMTLDLDHPACQGSQSLEEVCRQSLVAGADLLLLSPKGAQHIPKIARYLAQSVDAGTLPLERLTSAATAVSRHAL